MAVFVLEINDVIFTENSSGKNFTHTDMRRFETRTCSERSENTRNLFHLCKCIEFLVKVKINYEHLFDSTCEQINSGKTTNLNFAMNLLFFFSLSNSAWGNSSFEQ